MIPCVERRFPAGRCKPRKRDWHPWQSGIGADLREDLQRRKALDARTELLLHGGARGPNAGLHHSVDSGNDGIEGIDLIEMKPQQEARLRCHTTSAP
jgi:hypothetical protein